MSRVRAKKHLGQHFLTDRNIARKIVEGLKEVTGIVLEVGPGMGVLTEFLFEKYGKSLYLSEIDNESVEYLKKHFPELKENIIEGDFLKEDLKSRFNSKVSVIGNFPYNISSQIFFKILDNRNNIPQVVGMIQKEVAERIAAKPGSKIYGILSVLLKAFYDIEYMFTVNENVFSPPPKVKSAVVRLTRNNRENLNCDEGLFFRIVKATFLHRRKTIRNTIKMIPHNFGAVAQHKFMSKRPEQLSVDEFEELTLLIQNNPVQ
ncbi:MAG: 16S rRNA (adenine(1518)-N(6)/adenine(1519)-N(6))-dimethyltransferase RsmA [Chlorobi bacterium]|nr:16S rRNA (adenine(1518)-N(6)/adenine(1519)-N(6))-dimethyltransferase RsmA [Chlorobiota bacterium]